MGQLVFILGRSGTGKSYSMRSFPIDKLAVINVQGKILPFKGSGKLETTAVDQSDKILKALDIYSKNYKSIVIDDYQYVMANEFMRRSAERGYDKFTEIGRHAWDIANKVRELPQDVIVYIMCHIDRDDDGNEKIKTIGKLLDEKICLEGMSTIVLKTNVTDGVYSFVTQNNGKDTVKSPSGMFPSYAIDNDLYYVDSKIRNYYELGEYLPDATISAMDETAKNEEISMDKKKRGRTAAQEETVAPEEKSRRRKNVKEELAEKTAQQAEDYIKKVDELNADDQREEIPFEEIKLPEPEALPKRKRRETPAEETPVKDQAETPAEEAPASEEPKTRRRRRI